MSPLMIAVQNENTNPDVIRALIDAGSNVSSKSYDDKRAIDYLDANTTLYGTDTYWNIRDLLY